MKMFHCEKMLAIALARCIRHRPGFRERFGMGREPPVEEYRVH
jgi:hypothetical protein